ncbi:MAG: HIT family protein [Planctomycetota bacterium]|nr:MAG: HIT family protein [Planctomycetota bacterium]RKY10535.1 MAG: HIT family protein [Planctomycetota bacterium]
MSVQDCIFCKIIDRQVPCTKIYENEHVLAFLDVGPVSEGHVLVVLKEHTTRMDLTDPLAMAEVAKVLPKLAGSVKDAMVADGYNVLCNNGASAGQVVEHMHFHIIPRKENDGVFNQWPSFQYPEGDAEVIAEKIRRNLTL